MKLHLPQRRLWRAAIYLTSLVLILIAIDLIFVQLGRTIRPGYSTTRITSPVLPDGRIDYLLAVDDHFGRGVTPENNAAIPFLRALGRQALSPAQPTNGVTDRLGMEPLSEKGNYLQTFQNFRTLQNLPDEQDIRELLKDGDPHLQIGPVARQWIKTYDLQLNLIVDASRLSRFFIPFYAGHRDETMISVQLRHAGSLRESTRALLTRAAIRLETGDVAGFRNDVLAVHRWSRLLSQSQTLVERLVAIDMERTACLMDRFAATSGRLPATDARAHADDLAHLSDLPSPVDIIDAGERYFILDLCQWMARGGSNNVAVFLDEIVGPGGGQVHSWTKFATHFLPLQYEDSMRTMNAFDDGVIIAWRQPTWAQRRQAMQLWEDDARQLGSRNLLNDFLSGDWPVRFLLPSFTHIMELDESAHAELRLTRIALAISIYKSQHNTYPASLTDLTPADVSADPFTDASFIYTRTPTGYRLYSVGPNMIDDNDNHQKPQDDISASFPTPPKP
ncbi:MAG TPA: hypothetical protein VFE58_09615 [Tepidisphaeraceae bacterium]|jgi:hypothetical protein|nr:hypothetical protein [Tepidisphaeraceae bacterium]